MSSFEKLLLEQTCAVRAYALMLSGGRAEADDLVQDTLEKALRARDQFAAGSNMRAWLLTILRNTHSSDWRRSRRMVADIDGANAARLSVEAVQVWRTEYAEALAAINRLDPESRHALLLITAGLTYEEAAMACDCALRTLQSRVRRARARLAGQLQAEDLEDA
ncbi:sigma-70 family RNA polymerase sigma factor [Brevundimonas sp. PAMC22021]|uniref:sigma-70 family RNA polymerase sigma factor n=1 Tax=Brevundimonas sp. PAMC22021 TaxID=2861285 RepID=UPI0021057331|nr:sigma-70 family RNA polymerase sigma factor [Brevundimonas sp. PAMC22021]